MQETWVWPLIQEDPTCQGAAKPVRHNYGVHPGARILRQEKLAQWEAHSLQLEEARAQPRKPSTAKTNA